MQHIEANFDQKHFNSCCTQPKLMVLEDDDLCLPIGFTEANILSCTFDKDCEKVSYDWCEMPTDYIINK